MVNYFFWGKQAWASNSLGFISCVEFYIYLGWIPGSVYQKGPQITGTAEEKWCFE